MSVLKLPRRTVIIAVCGVIGVAVIFANLSGLGKTVTTHRHGNLAHDVDRNLFFSQPDAKPEGSVDEHHSCMYTHKINATMDMISDLKSTNHIWYPETKAMVQRCEKRDWGDLSTFPTLGVVVTFGEHESVYNVLHTVHAVVERTPPEVLREVVIVDDNSTKDEHKDLMANYLRMAFGDMIKIYRSDEELGLIRARKVGGMLVTADVIAFFDSHQEVQPGWAEPLLLEIKRNPKTLAAGCLDWMEKKGSSWEYIHGPISWVTVFDWNFDFQFQDINTEKVVKRQEPTESFPSPMMIGNTYAIGREYFHEIGTFDGGMNFWGGENVDLSLRAWMCGGQVRISPCSRASHLEGGNLRGYRGNHKDWSQHNYKRVTDVWLDEYKDLVYNIKPHFNSMDVGDLSERIALRKKCTRSFEWYLENAAPYFGVPRRDGLGYGGAKNKKYGGCLDTLQSRVVGMWDNCDRHSHSQGFYWDKLLNMRFPLHIFNMDGISEDGRNDQGLRFSEFLVYYNTSWPRSTYIHWKDGPFIEVKSMLCLEALTDRQVGFRPCKEIDEQTWSFIEYSQAYHDMIDGAAGYEELQAIFIDTKQKYEHAVKLESKNSKPKWETRKKTVVEDSPRVKENAFIKDQLEAKS